MKYLLLSLFLLGCSGGDDVYCYSVLSHGKVLDKSCFDQVTECNVAQRQTSDALTVEQCSEFTGKTICPQAKQTSACSKDD